MAEPPHPDSQPSLRYLFKARLLLCEVYETSRRWDFQGLPGPPFHPPLRFFKINYYDTQKYSHHDPTIGNSSNRDSCWLPTKRELHGIQCLHFKILEIHLLWFKERSHDWIQSILHAWDCKSLKIFLWSDIMTCMDSKRIRIVASCIWIAIPSKMPTPNPSTKTPNRRSRKKHNSQSNIWSNNKSITV